MARCGCGTNDSSQAPGHYQPTEVVDRETISDPKMEKPNLAIDILAKERARYVRIGKGARRGES